MKDIVVAGIGAVTPLGRIAPRVWTLWRNLLASRNSFRSFSFDPAVHNITAKMASEFPRFDFAPYAWRIPLLRNRKISPSWERMDRMIQLGLAAGLEALTMAHLAPTEEMTRRPKIGLIVGTGLGGGRSFEEGVRNFDQRGKSLRISFTVLNVMANNLQGVGTIAFRLGGPSYTVVSACASSGHALATAIDKVDRGQADVMLVIGSEAVTTAFQEGCFNQMDALSINGASIPFGLNRDGFVMGEGAGAAVVTSKPFALANGMPILARIGGYGMCADAEDMAKPSVVGIIESMDNAIDDANQRCGLRLEDIGYVNAHGTSTPIGDAQEALAIWQLFCDPSLPYLDRIPAPFVSSTKAGIGHCLGAAGILGLISTILALRAGRIPGMGKYELDPACVRPWLAAGLADPRVNTLPIVTKTIDTPKLRWAICNSFGFGGPNVSVVVGRP